MTKGAKAARLILFLLAGALLTYYLLARSGSVSETVNSIFSALASCSIQWLLLSLLLFFLSLLIRAWRWQLLAGDHTIPVVRSMSLTAVHVGLGHLLPVRLADVALVGLFRKYAAIPAGSGAATVMLAKIMDIIAMGTVVALSFLTGLSGPVVAIASGIAVTGTAMLFFLPFMLKLVAVPLKAVTGEGRVSKALNDMTEAARLTPENRKPLFLAVAASFAGWTLKLFMFLTLLRSVGVHSIPLWQVFTAGAVTDFILALPVHGLLSLGTVEAGWVAGFALTGITGTLSGGISVVEAGFSVHLLWLFMAVLLMSAGTLVLLFYGKDLY